MLLKVILTLIGQEFNKYYIKSVLNIICYYNL